MIEDNDFFPPLPSSADNTSIFEKSLRLREQMNEVVEWGRQLVYMSKSIRYRANKFNKPDFSLPILHTCSCGTKFSPCGWANLPLVGYQTINHLDAEMRNCPCGSTLTLIIERRQCNGT